MILWILNLIFTIYEKTSDFLPLHLDIKKFIRLVIKVIMYLIWYYKLTPNSYSTSEYIFASISWGIFDIQIYWEFEYLHNFIDQNTNRELKFNYIDLAQNFIALIHILINFYQGHLSFYKGAIGLVSLISDCSYDLIQIIKLRKKSFPYEISDYTISTYNGFLIGYFYSVYLLYLAGNQPEAQNSFLYREFYYQSQCSGLLFLYAQMSEIAMQVIRSPAYHRQLSSKSLLGLIYGLILGGFSIYLSIFYWIIFYIIYCIKFLKKLCKLKFSCSFFLYLGFALQPFYAYIIFIYYYQQSQYYKYQNLQ